MNNPLSQAKPITYNGVTYPSIGKMAKAFGVSHKTITNKLKAGLPIYSKNNIKPITIRGVKYKSLSEAAREIGMSVGYISKALSRGVDPDEIGLNIKDIKKYKPIYIDGRLIKNKTEFRKIYDITEYQLNKWINDPNINCRYATEKEIELLKNYLYAELAKQKGIK